MSAKQNSIPVGEHRRAARVRSHINVEVTYQERKVTGKVFDISRTGLCLDIEQIFMPPMGAVITISCKQIGVIEGHVRWQRNGRIGVSFGNNSNSTAKVISYFRHVHPEAMGRL